MDIKEVVAKAQEYSLEIDTIETYKNDFLSRLKIIEDDYQNQKYGYLEYKKRKDLLLRGKSKNEWLEFYSNSQKPIAKKIEDLLSAVFYTVYKDDYYKKVHLVHLKKERHENIKASQQMLAVDQKINELKTNLAKPVEIQGTPIEPQKVTKAQEVKQEIKELREQKPKFSLLAQIKSYLKKIHLPKISIPKPKKAPSVKLGVPKLNLGLKGFSQRVQAVFTGKKKSIFSEVLEMEKETVATQEDIPEDRSVKFGLFGIKNFAKEFLSNLSKKQETFVGKETKVPPHLKKLKKLREQIYQRKNTKGFDSSLLAQEARRVKRILETETLPIYKGSSIGLVANITVKKISLYLIDHYPSLFEGLYNRLRAANMRVLSNTYVNIMILVTLISVVVVTIGSFITFFYLNYQLYQVFIRSVLFGAFSAAASVGFFYMYPSFKIKERNKSLQANMPFATNHLASVASSGVSPVRMFELIAESDEYGEVAVEAKKIVDFMNIFGYDLLTALKAVSSSTPSLSFKEFMDGMISTIETGGDLYNFLKQKSEEFALSYQLERQKYSEIVSTYSDIYTGVLIAAPLFFIAALALVNILGGSIAGFEVEFIMAMGAYGLIPLLNMGFIVFLQLTQPEV